MANYMTVVIRMPEDEVQGKTIAHTFAIGTEFHGGKVVAASSEDEMTLAELLCDKVGDFTANEVRKQVRAMQSRAEAIDA